MYMTSRAAQYCLAGRRLESSAVNDSDDVAKPYMVELDGYINVIGGNDYDRSCRSVITSTMLQKTAGLIAVI